MRAEFTPIVRAAEEAPEHSLAKRVVTWGDESEGEQSPKPPRGRTSGRYSQQPARNPSFNVHGIPAADHPGDSPKWKPARGQNTFGGQGKEADEWYDGVSSESKKPHREKPAAVERNPAGIAAVYEPTTGARCPTPDATGLFAYPPDCKFYVTCWKGRAFVMPCSPGTLFSPDTLECDFPAKVKCYGGEPADFATGPDHDDGRSTELLVQQTRANLEAGQRDEPVCPANLSGLMALPSDCTKYVQCANGLAYVMDCGPGTAFNPSSNVCDWPHNVPGCSTPPVDAPSSRKNHQRDHSTVHEYPVQGSSESQPVDSQYQGSSAATRWESRVIPGHQSPRAEDDSGYTPGAPSHEINGHAHPYGPQQFHGGPVSEVDEASSEEDTRSSEAGYHRGWAWSQPVGENRPYVPRDRRPYAREDDGLAVDVRAPGGGDAGWRGMGRGFEQRPSYPARDLPSTTERVSTTVTINHRPFERPVSPNIYNSDSERWIWSPSSKNETIPAAKAPRGQIFEADRGTGVRSTANGTRGHFITQTPLIFQGHSQTRTQNSRALNESLPSASHRQHVMTIPPRHPVTWRPFFNTPASPRLNVTMITSTGVEKPKPDSKYESPEIFDSNKKKEFSYIGNADDESDVPTVSIELEEEWNSSLPLPPEKPSKKPIVGKKFSKKRPEKESPSEYDNFEVEVETADGTRNTWRPQMVFNNRTDKDTDDKSSVMRVNKRKKPSFLLEVELAPFLDEEPPFPTHYTPEKSASLVVDSFKSGQVTPLSGQIIRLRDGSQPSEGYVEVQGSQPGWGVVCDSKEGWTLTEAHIVCKQLGYARGAISAWQGRPKTSVVPKWIAANGVTCHGNETKFQFCKFAHKPHCNVERDAVAVRCLPHRVAHCRNDEVPHNGRCYHFAEPSQAFSHSEAHEYCHRRDSRLIDIVDQPENDFVSELLVQNQPHVDSIMTSGMGFSIVNRTIWTWEDASAAKFKYTKWWSGWMGDKKSVPLVGSRPVCIIMTRKFPCHNYPDKYCKTDYFFWDVEDCASSNKGHAYICERTYDDIGCMYGNGNQYFGNASVSSSGRACLPWSDREVARSLVVKVPDRDVRDGLKSHNHCRNPNPRKESKPWCFTGPRGELEYCDIPHCGKMLTKSLHLTGTCKPKHFECLPGECIPSPWVCDGQEDCTNGADERNCRLHMNFFKKYPKRGLNGFEVEKWLNTPAKTCALRCKEADFTCRSFTHHVKSNICYLSDSNIGMTGALTESDEHDYYEMRDRSIDCDDMFVCANGKCVDRGKVCDGKNDCIDRSDEKTCTAEKLDYGIRLVGSNLSHEGRIEVKTFGKWGQVCDDGFDMNDANVVCKELGFQLGALEVKPGGYYGNLDPPDAFMVDQLKCHGSESTIRECDFEGWGKHDCDPGEAAGVVCKTDADVCPIDRWKCDDAPMCIPTPFICDEVKDCPDGSDESSRHCDAPFELRLANGSSPLEGRVEVRHHGIWGTVCDDDFSQAAATVICRSLGYGGPATVKKNGHFGPGTGPIWLDEVYCLGNETLLSHCEHDYWGRHNCHHNEDAGIVCTAGPIPHEYESMAVSSTTAFPIDIDINDLLPSECGKRFEDFDPDDDLMYARVVKSSIAPRGSYPWQASVRVRGHSKSNHWCGAVIISPLHVLTAAHCLEGYNKGTFFIRAGDYDTEADEGTELEANIEDYYVHEEFRKGRRLNNDIAVVLLKGQGIPLGRNAMPVCLPHENFEYPAGLNCTISGFGSVEPGSKSYSRKLRYGWVPILEQSVCKSERVYGTSISEGMMCAGYLSGGTDTCDGDSGGPLVCLHNGAFTLYGLTSWGWQCGRADKPGVYSRIAYYRKWIEQKIKESMTGR
ncbi:uncharacterized protein LOC106641736 [Copidosoma floridanum]|uniref:uncharacterized protein LOC106641736 n=1 Tax=Copidosoma floridanum TaxID=29053 RepID=UPI000C6F71A2|nr:uncharacterized protein LOC106641736 [Copidosoma floridanum]